MEYTDVETGKRRDPPTAGLSVGTGFALLVFVACLVIAGFMIKDAGSSSSPVTPPSAVTTTSKFRLGFDKNIGLPENISDLVKGIIGKTKSYRGKEFTVSATGYTNVQELYNKRAEFDFLFIPAGVLPYLDKYTVLATSVMPGAEPPLQTQMTTMVYNPLHTISLSLRLFTKCASMPRHSHSFVRNARCNARTVPLMRLKLKSAQLYMSTGQQWTIVTQQK